ncbi:MAG: hypothetical protein V4547_17290 [Bacteroidota bacterium]
MKKLYIIIFILCSFLGVKNAHADSNLDVDMVQYWEVSYTPTCGGSTTYYEVQNGVNTNILSHVNCGDSITLHHSDFTVSPYDSLVRFRARNSIGDQQSAQSIYLTDEPVLGCTDPDASNYDSGATEDDGSCTYPPPPDTIGDLISSSDSGFQVTTGFSVGGVMDWSATNLIKLFIGSGLAILYGLRYWVVALIIIAGIILFARRALRFRSFGGSKRSKKNVK